MPFQWQCADLQGQPKNSKNPTKANMLACAIPCIWCVECGWMTILSHALNDVNRFEWNGWNSIQFFSSLFFCWVCVSNAA